MSEHRSKTPPKAPGQARPETEVEPQTQADTLKGSVKEAIGKLIGDGTMEAEGRSEQTRPPQQSLLKSGPKPKTTPKP